MRLPLPQLIIRECQQSTSPLSLKELYLVSLPLPLPNIDLVDSASYFQLLSFGTALVSLCQNQETTHYRNGAMAQNTMKTNFSGIFLKYADAHTLSQHCF